MDGSPTESVLRNEVALLRPTIPEWSDLAIFAKMQVGGSDDVAEREADRLADEAMGAVVPPAGHLGPENRTGACSGTCGRCSCGGREPAIRPSTAPATAVPSAGGASVREAPDLVREVLSSPGSLLDAGTRTDMESRFGHDFGQVQVHTDQRASSSARQIGALAYTAGSEIVFGEGSYAPASDPGRRLLAHELGHVVSNGVSARLIHRQEDKSAATIELCFVPIRAYDLSTVGGVHAVLNIPGPAGVIHVEVDPSQHQAAQDPGAPPAGPGHVAGLHSHVVIAAGTKSADTCQTIAVKHEQTAAVLAAARSYEALDVGYEPPGLGPNSNSFPEWALHEAGVDTSLVPAPAGAAGWSYYLDHPTERAAPPRVARTFAATQSTCPTAGTKATSFTSLVALLRRAETELTDKGMTDVGQQLAILRGIFYGTPWSQDFATSQSSPLRNAMFNVYSGASQPDNPLKFLSCDTFLSLARSQDVKDRGRWVDVGHMLIGMDARRSAVARAVAQPVGQVTGLEAVTWAGDLGGGAARLSLDRIGNSAVLVTKYFLDTDYGGSINLEGDVAGYAVGTPAVPAAAGAAPPLSIPAGSGVADAFETYLIGTETTGRGWDSRCQVFLRAVGGTLDTAGALTNRAQVLDYLTEQIHDFGCWYLVNFVRQNRGLNAATLEQASRHMAGAASEVAGLFLGALERCSADPSQAVLVTGAAPAPTPIGSPSCLLARAAPEAGAAAERVGKEAVEVLDEASRWIEQRRQEAERSFRRWWNQ